MIKTPERMCIVCRIQRPKKELLRIVKSKEGNIFLDFTGKKPGRGAYICPTTECLAKAEKNKGLERSFKASVDPGIYDQLRKELESYDGQ